jgi:hypothetical protein
LQITTPVETGCRDDAGDLFGGVGSRSPTLFCPATTAKGYADLQISFVAAKGGGDLDYLSVLAAADCRGDYSTFTCLQYCISSDKNSGGDVLY